MAITIRVPWQDPYNHGDAWNELLAWTVETFGLPGDRMQFHPTEAWMDFTFDSEHDALMFQLKSAGHRKQQEELTVEYVGNIINGV
jgi:hypothetical protein